MPEITRLEDLETTPHAEVFERRRPRTVRLRLSADERIPPHRHPGTDVVLHLLEGHFALDLDGETYDLGAGDLVRFDGGSEVSPLAIEPSTAVIVFSPHPT